MNIGFWVKESKNYLSHSKGLSMEQVEFLKTLKEGDRLILWNNNKISKMSEMSPDLSLKKFIPGGD